MIMNFVILFNRTLSYSLLNRPFRTLKFVSDTLKNALQFSNPKTLQLPVSISFSRQTNSPILIPGISRRESKKHLAYQSVLL